MINEKELKGTKVIKLKETKDGYGDIIFRVSVAQKYNTGIDVEERFIESKTFTTEKRARKWINTNY